MRAGRPAFGATGAPSVGRRGTASRLALALVAAIGVAAALGACSRRTPPAETRPPAAVATEAPALPAAAPAPVELVRAPAAVAPIAAPPEPPAPRPPDRLPALAEGSPAETRQIAEELYRGMHPSIPEADRRQAARTMAEDLQAIAREQREGPKPPGPAEVLRQQEAERVEALQARCTALRFQAETQEQAVRDASSRPQPPSAEQLAIVAGAARQARAQLAASCP